MSRNTLDNFDNRSTHQVLPQSQQQNTKSIIRKHASWTKIIFALAVGGGIVLVILCAVEFRQINTYVTAQCLILSNEVSQNYGVGSLGGVLYRVAWRVILYDTDGVNTTTLIWSSISKSPPAWIVYSIAAQYQNNHTYKCYHKSSSISPGNIQFDQPSKTKAIGYLIGGILIILCSILILILKGHILRRYVHRKSQQQSNNQIHSTTVEMTSVRASEQNLNRSSHATTNNIAIVEDDQRREDSLRPPNTPPPPSYDEAIEEINSSNSRRSLDHILNRFGLRRQTSNTVRL